MQVFEQVVGQCVLNIPTIELQAENHDAELGKEVEVGLADDLLLFGFSSGESRVPSVPAFVGFMGREDFREIFTSNRYGVSVRRVSFETVSISCEKCLPRLSLKGSAMSILEQAGWRLTGRGY